MDTQTTWFRTVATLLSLSMALIGCASAPIVIEPTAASITREVVAGDHVEVQTQGQTMDFWVTALNDTRLQGTEGPNDQGRPVDVAIADILSIRVYQDKDSGGGRSNTLTIVLVVIGVIAAIALFSNDSAEDRFQGFPDP